MYFLDQLKTQFFLTLTLHTTGGEGVSQTAGEARDGETQTPPLAEQQGLTPERQAQLDTLDEIKDELAWIQAAEHIVGQRLEVIGRHLEEISAWEDPQASADDPEFAELRETYERVMEEYRGLAVEQQQVDHIVRQRLAEFSQEVDEVIIELGGSVEDVDFTVNEVQELRENRNTQVSNLEQSLQTFLGERYTQGSDMRWYAEVFAGTDLEATYREYMRITDPERGESEHINSQWQTLTYDVDLLHHLNIDANIALRDAREIDGKSFGEIRDERIAEIYEALQGSEDERILNIISTVWEDGERVFTPLWELSTVQIAELRGTAEEWYDLRQLFLVSTSWEAFNSENIQAGSSFVLNTGGNNEILHDFHLHHLEWWAQTLVIEWQEARYDPDGRNGAWYYTEHGRVLLRDGMEIQYQAAEETTTPNPERRAQADREVSEVQTQAAARDLYRRAQENPDEPLSTEWMHWLMVVFLKALEAISGRDIIQDETTGEFWYTDASWNYVPLTWAEFSERYEGNIISYPVERSASGTTLCSRTARLNLWRLWVPSPNGWPSARAAFEAYGGTPDTNFPTSPAAANATRADIYLDASPRNRQYGHRAAAFKENGNWFVLDPYYNIPPHGNTRQPIPVADYMNHMMGAHGRRFWWAHYM